MELSIDDNRLLRIIRYATISIAFAYFAVYLFIVFKRIGYPFELEWIEGGMVDQVSRIVHGQSVYVAPSVNFVPFLYSPLYFYVSAVASQVLGGGLFPLRFISFAASLVSFTTIVLIVHHETKNWWAGVLSAGLFAAAFRVTGAWLDIARVDSLFLALWLLFLYFVRHGKAPRYALLAGIACSLAFLTKQTAIILCLPIIVYLFWENRKYALLLLATTASMIGVTTLILDRASSGWYTYYVFQLLLQQGEWLPLKFVTFWFSDLLVHLPVASLFVLFAFMEKPSRNRFDLTQWSMIFAGALAGSFSLRIKQGGYDNVLLPAYAVVSILFGLGLGKLLKAIHQMRIDYRVIAEKMIHIACLIQLVLLVYNPLAQIPSDSDRKAGNEFIQSLSTQGIVYLPDHGYLSVLAGKTGYAHQSAIWDVVRGDRQTIGKSLLTESLNHAIGQQIFDVIVFDSEWNVCCSEIDTYYTLTDNKIFQDESVFYPVTGWRRRPTFIYLAKRLQGEVP